MTTIPQCVCGVIPPHMLDRVAAQPDDLGSDARATLEHMRELASSQTLVDRTIALSAEVVQPRKRRNVYDAQHHRHLPGKLVMSEHKPRTNDVEVNEAYDGSGATYDFFAQVYGRRSIDNRGLRLDSTVHYGEHFNNAMWAGRQMVYGDGDGRVFNRFTAAPDVIGHELTHGVTQFSAGLGYSGQTGALNEHISDAFGIMVKQWWLGLSARASDWLIGAGLFAPNINARGVRSMAAPGSAYDDPILGRDPQPSHMRNYKDTTDDNGGVHINSGIPNHAFYLAAMALDGYAWEVLGRVWYIALTERLRPDAVFTDFARATTDIAGEQFGNGGHVQCVIADAWQSVGLDVPLFTCDVPHSSRRSRRRRADANPHLTKWRQRPVR